MKQFKAEWQIRPNEGINDHDTILHLITKHNAMCDFLEEREQQSIPTETNEVGVTIPKPQWWTVDGNDNANKAKGYKQALSDASKALGITFKIEE